MKNLPPSLSVSLSVFLTHTPSLPLSRSVSSSARQRLNHSRPRGPKKNSHDLEKCHLYAKIFEEPFFLPLSLALSRSFSPSLFRYFSLSLSLSCCFRTDLRREQARRPRTFKSSHCPSLFGSRIVEDGAAVVAQQSSTCLMTERLWV